MPYLAVSAIRPCRTLRLPSCSSIRRSGKPLASFLLDSAVSTIAVNPRTLSPLHIKYSVSTVAVTTSEKRGRKYSTLATKERDRALKAKYRAEKRYDYTGASKKSQHLKKVRAFMLLGGRCENCGDNRMQALELDHINGNGSKERKSLGHIKMFNEVFKRPSDFQLLCGTCHNLKTSGFLEANNLL